MQHAASACIFVSMASIVVVWQTSSQRWLMLHDWMVELNSSNYISKYVRSHLRLNSIVAMFVQCLSKFKPTTIHVSDGNLPRSMSAMGYFEYVPVRYFIRLRNSEHNTRALYSQFARRDVIPVTWRNSMRLELLTRSFADDSSLEVARSMFTLTWSRS